MNISVRANVRTAEAARTSLQGGLTMAFRSGAITGMLVAGLGLLAISGFFWYLVGPAAMAPTRPHVVNALTALAFGASLISIFARLGGGIFTKAADVGADLVGKVEAGIPEDDPRNPAAIADNVGDNVGDCAGMAADLFETYVVTIGVTMVSIALLVAGRCGAAPADDAAADRRRRLHHHLDHRHLFRPARQGGSRSWARSTRASGDRAAVDPGDLWFAHQCVLGDMNAAIGGTARRRRTGRPRPPRIATFTGMEAVLVHADRPGGHRPAGLDHRILYRHQLPPGPVDRQGVADRPRHQRHPGPGDQPGIDRAADARHRRRGHRAYQLAGVIGIAFAATAMLALAGMVVALDAYGPVTDNAGGIAEMAGLPDDVRHRTDALDAVGNTTKAVTKGYAIGSAALAALVLFGAYTTDLHALSSPTSTGRFLAVQPVRHRRPAARRAAALSVRRVRR